MNNELIRVLVDYAKKNYDRANYQKTCSLKKMSSIFGKTGKSDEKNYHYTENLCFLIKHT